MRDVTRSVCGLVATVLMVFSVTPAAAKEAAFSGLVPVKFDHKWEVNEWVVWALPGGLCDAEAQYPDQTPFRFWGFRQSNGSRVDLYFGSIENARPQTVQMSFNDGENFAYAAQVEHQADWDSYVISLQPDALSVFHDDTFVDAYVDDEKVFWGVTHSMRNLEKTMAKCLTWQEGH